MTRARTAIVIGGGIAGLASGLALRKAGIEPVVYEAHSNGAEGLGVFLTVASNGIDALRALDADAPVLEAGFSTPAITLRSSTGKRLGETRTGGALPDGTCSQTIKRADLYRLLDKLAGSRGVRVELGKRLVAAEASEDGARATFADGTEAEGDVLIGCDGVHSTVRRIVDPAAPAPTYAGLVNTGGYARGVEVEAAPGSYEMIFGKRAFFGYALAPGGEVWWFANVPRREEPARGEVEPAGGEELRRRLGDLYADDAGPAVSLVDATPEIMPLSPIHSIPHLPAWHRGPIIAIGDAAHAPSPSSGQGASLAVEDAVVLAKCLRDRPDPQHAFTQFEAERRPRVEQIIKWAARINASKAAGPIGRFVRDAMLPVVLRLTADGKAQRAAYDHHIDWGSPA